MFCLKCGAELQEDVKFCPQCGAAYGSQPIEKRFLSRKMLRVFVVTCIAAVLIAVGYIFLGSGVNSSAEKLAVAAVEGVFGNDVDKLIQALPDYTIRDYAQKVDLDENADRKQVAKALKKYYAEWDVQSRTIKVLSCEVIGKLNINDLLWDYYGMTRVEYDSITDSATVEVELLIDEEHYTLEVSCIKMDNKWYMYDVD